MKLLIITQVVDTEDSVLGFFVRWIEEFAKHAGVTVQAHLASVGDIPTRLHEDFVRNERK